MKNLLKLLLILAVTFFAAYVAYASEEVVKWTQFPDMGPFGYAFASETAKPSLAADDFECIGGEPVVAVRWWGSYYEPFAAAHFYPNSAQWNDPTTPTDTPEDMLTGFNISFYANVPAGTDPSMPWAHPGNSIYSATVAMVNISEVLYGTVTHTSGVEQNVWQYYVSLPETGFEQEEGLTYWISIQGIHGDQEIQWGWQEALQPGWNADMVQQGYNQYFRWDLVPNKELAFELITQEGEIPEPASILMLSFGALGLFLTRKVRTKKHKEGIFMKHTQSFIIVFACALFMSFAAFGQTTPPVAKWSQPPDMTGYDWSSETAVPSAVADDWLCGNGLPINQITWWGSYYTPAVFPYRNSDNFQDQTIPSNTTPGTVTGFIISIYSDAGPGGVYSWSHPGDLLYTKSVEATETLFGVATKPGGQQENIWEYNVFLEPNDVFEQELGTRYWLSIVAIDSLAGTQPTIQWGWHQTDKSLYGYGDDAVQSGFSQNPNITWDLLVDTEMAFELHSIPEPSMIALSIIGFLAIGWKKRK